MSKEQPTTITWDDDDPLAGFLMTEEPETEESVDESEENPAPVDEPEQSEETEEIVETQTQDFDDTQEEEEEIEESSPQMAAKVLHDLGIIDLKGDEKEIDEVVIQEKLEERIQQGILEQFNEMANSLDEDSYKLVDYLLKGGSWKDFQGLQQQSASKGFQIDTEDDKRRFLEYYYTQIEGKTQTRAKREIDFLEDEGTLDDEAEELYDKLKKAESQLMQQEIEAKKKQQAESARLAREREQMVVDNLKSSNGYNDISLSTRDKKIIERDILKKTEYNKETKKYETKLTQMLRDTFSDPKKLIALDYVLRNDFKLDIVKKKGATEVISKTERELQRKTPPRTKKSASSKPQVPLWEQMDRNK
jgi:hypothetical protein